MTALNLFLLGYSAVARRRIETTCIRLRRTTHVSTRIALRRHAVDCAARRIYPSALHCDGMCPLTPCDARIQAGCIETAHVQLRDATRMISPPRWVMKSELPVRPRALRRQTATLRALPPLAFRQSFECSARPDEHEAPVFASEQHARLAPRGSRSIGAGLGYRRRAAFVTWRSLIPEDSRSFWCRWQSRQSRARPGPVGSAETRHQ